MQRFPALALSSHSSSTRTHVLMLAAVCLPMAAVCLPLAAQQMQYSPVQRSNAQVLPQTLSGGSAKLQARLAAGRTALSLAVADFDTDGTNDLITGYAAAGGGVLLLQRGSPVAFAPTPNEWAMVQRGELVAPFVEKAEPIELPVRPDFLKTADLSGQGHVDVLVAQKGDTSVYLLLGDGRGGFAAPQAFAPGGVISSLATWRGLNGENFIVAGVCGASGCGLRLLDHTGNAVAFVPTSGSPEAMEVAGFNGGTFADVAVIAGGKVLLVDGDSLLSGRPRTETLPVSHADALASGQFVYDRRGIRQLAVLDAGGTLHILTRAGIDSSSLSPLQARAAAHAPRAERASVNLVERLPKLNGQTWAEVETLPNVGGGDGSAPVMVRGRFQGGGMDELAVLSGTRYTLVTHATKFANGAMTTTPTLTVDSFSGAVVAAVNARIGATARTGLILLDGGAQPMLSELPANRTMTVNTTTDQTPTTASMSACESGGTCMLRSAIAVANSDAAANGTTKADTINLAAGTYTLSATQTAGTYDTQADFNYHFPVDSSINLVGAGSGTTIINAAFLDTVFIVGSGINGGNENNGFYNPVSEDVYISGVTLENGLNRNDLNTSPCNGAVTITQAPFCLSDGGAISDATFDGGGLTLNSVIIQNSAAVYSGQNTNDNSYAYGGAVDIENATPPTVSSIEIDNSTFTSNKAADDAGAVGVDEIAGNCMEYSFTSDIFTGNISGQSTDSTSISGYASGGAVYANGVSAGAGYCSQSSLNNTITTLTATGNTALDRGGALNLVGPVTATGLALSNNQAGSFGGGLYLSPSDLSATVSSSNFTTNTLVGNSKETYSGYGGSANGAGVCVESSNSGTAATIQYSRFHGNTIPATSSGPKSTGLGVSCQGGATNDVTVAASNNWWGCNPTTSGTSIAGTGCDTANAANNGDELLSAPTYTTLTLSLNTNMPAYGTTITATGSLGQNSSGAVYTAAQDAAYLVTPITTFTLTNTGSVTYNPSSTAFGTGVVSSSISNAAATASGTATTPGASTATIKVDGQTLTANYTITAADLTVTSSHTGNFKAGDTADTYSLIASNTGTASTSGTVTVVDTLPSGFTATTLSGGGWSCTLGTLTCTRSDALAASVSYPAITLTVSVASTDIGTYTNAVTVSGGNEANTSNDTGLDPTIVVGPPTIAETVGASPVAPGTSTTLTFTLGNPSANLVSLTGVAFTDTLQSGLAVATPNGAATTCSGGTVTATPGSSSISLAGATIASGATCTVTVKVVSSTTGTYTSTTGTVTATNSNAGGTASATVTVSTTRTMTIISPTVASGSSAYITAYFDFSGTVAPTGAVTMLVNGSSAAISGLACVSKSLHVSCTASYSASGVPAGQYVLTVSQAADSNYVAVSGTGTVTVTGATMSVVPVRKPILKLPVVLDELR